MNDWVLYVGTSVDVFEISSSDTGVAARPLGTEVAATRMDGARAVLVARDGTLFVGSTTRGLLRSRDGGA